MLKPSFIADYKNTLLLLLCLFSSTKLWAQHCELDNAVLQAMPNIKLSFFKNSENIEVVVKVADSNETRAAGFQKICQSTINTTSILFLFPQATKARFHMNNVVAPLDIAFINQQGVIESIQTMQPYVLGSRYNPLYGPKGLAIGALETYQGFFAEHQITVGTKVIWKQ